MLRLTEEQSALKDAAAEAAAAILETLKDDESGRSVPFQAGRQDLRRSVAGRARRTGPGYSEYAITLEEIARVSASYGVSVAVTGLPQVILDTFGSEAQKATYLPSLAMGETIGAFALSEPDSGSDAASLQSTAILEGDQYRLNGTKFWITHGGYADLYVVMARSGGEGPKGVSAFLVPGDTPGLSFGKKEEKMGLRASPTVEVVMRDVMIPAENRLGQEGDGFKVAMSALDSGRITIAAISVGIAQAALDTAAAYACQRKQFKKAIIDFQGVGFMLADMACKIESSRRLSNRRTQGCRKALQSTLRWQSASPPIPPFRWLPTPFRCSVDIHASTC